MLNQSLRRLKIKWFLIGVILAYPLYEIFFAVLNLFYNPSGL